LQLCLVPGHVEALRPFDAEEMQNQKAIRTRRSVERIMMEEAVGGSSTRWEKCRMTRRLSSEKPLWSSLLLKRALSQLTAGLLTVRF